MEENVTDSGDTPLTLTGENVHEYNWSDATPLVNGVRAIIQGTATANGGCTFHHTVTAGPDDAQVVTREIAYDPTTCRGLYETAVIAGDSIAFDEVDPGGTTGTKRRKWEGVFRDPPPINAVVNRSYSSLHWRYNSGTNVVTELASRCVLGWTEQTGWWVEYYSGCLRGYYDNNSEYAVESSTQFDNDVWPCLAPGYGATTRIFDHLLIVHGSGGITATTSMSKWGPCAWMLRSEATLSIGY